ncbi:hypothetical protein sos41_34100 [Alphaproteobacteria bacterium SO-S41]|nr:hypothetical protein sos41_34100 [Alphaproteobacteria bacterium SO-S41]
MHQFDVIAALETHSAVAFLVILQHDSIDERGTAIVAPCIPFDMGPPNKRLTPAVEIGGARFVVLVAEMTAIERSTLRNRRAVANLALHRDAFIAAIDLLFTGV